MQRGHEIDSLRKQIEREYLEKVRLEDEIMEVIRNQLTFDKAAQYTDRMTRKCRQLTKDLVTLTILISNDSRPLHWVKLCCCDYAVNLIRNPATKR